MGLRSGLRPGRTSRPARHPDMHSRSARQHAAESLKKALTSMSPSAYGFQNP